MAKHLTDRQKKKIIADYVECENYSQVARKYKVSATTVKNTVLKDQKSMEMCEQKKEQNTAEILEHMDTKKEVVNQIIDTYLSALLDPEKIAKATPSQLTTALGTVIDKFTNTNPSEQALKKLDDVLGEIKSGF